MDGERHDDFPRILAKFVLPQVAIGVLAQRDPMTVEFAYSECIDQKGRAAEVELVAYFLEELLAMMQKSRTPAKQGNRVAQRWLQWRGCYQESRTGACTRLAYLATTFEKVIRATHSWWVRAPTLPRGTETTILTPRERHSPQAC